MMVRCSACGTMNAADDGFCGTCGTALSSDAAQATPESAAPQAIIDPTPPEPFQPPPEPLAGPAQFCGNCGAENAATRTFCRVCGSTLTATPAPPRARPAGSPAPRARDEDPQQAVVAQPATARPGAAARQRGGGGWIVLLAVLGLLAGALFVLLPSMLGQRSPADADPSRPAATGRLQEAGLPPSDRLAVLPMRSFAQPRAARKPS
jgi:hypothetical protein